MVTGLAFVDFRKAFDVINHELLLKKLYIYGANDLSLKWFAGHISLEENNMCVYMAAVPPVSRSASRINRRTHSLSIVCK